MLFIFTLTALGVGLGWDKNVQAGIGLNVKDSLNQKADSGVGFKGSAKQSTFLTVAGGSPKGPWDDISAAIRWVIEQVKNNLQKAYEQAGDIAYKNSLRYFLNRVAYDTATYIATGGAGKKPLFISEGWGAYFKSVGDEAIGDFFYNLGKEMWGKNLCEPWQPLAKINLTVAAKRALEPRKPICTWSKIRKNMNDLRDMKFDELVQLSAHFQPGSNDLGAYLTMRTGAYELKVKKENEANLVRIIEGGFKSVVNPITGAIKTPASVVDNAVNTVFNKTFVSSETYTGSPVADAIGTFTNTLVSKFLERIFKKGFNPTGQAVVSDLWSLGGVQAARLYFSELAEPDYKFNIGMSLDELSISGSEQYNGVINDSFTRAIEEKCTVGQATGFYKPGDEAYRAECMQGNNTGLMIGLISGTAPFGFDEDGNEPNPQNGIPYRSILALRKFRVVPVGWELAAEYYNNFGDKSQRLNLNFLLNQYDKKICGNNYALACQTDSDCENNVPCADSPYYGLVDPDWLLKLPITRCVREGASPKIPEETKSFAYCASDINKTEKECDEGDRIYAFSRMEYCADYETCLDDSGNKCDANDYGYCLEEKPIWSIKGTACADKNYASCQTLVQTNNDSKKVNYLLNTVSGVDICDKNNAGCREYCNNLQKPFTQNDWLCTSGSIENKTNLILAGEDKKCSKSVEGCSLVYKSSSKDITEVTDACNAGSDGLCNPTTESSYALLDKKYVKIAPYYYGCTGYTIKVPASSKAECTGDNFWRDDLNVCVKSGSKECANFAKFCQAEDASCKLYTPTSGRRPGVPAVIEQKDCSGTATGDCSDETDPGIVWNNECPASCVGYKNYHQSKTYFESEEEANFIASTGKTCSEPGCDQFTNLDEVAKGGEGIEYYSYLRECVKPNTNDATQKTYYTWEGSDTSGYQLKKWLLKSKATDGTGGPDGESCTNLAVKDCREFYDQNLKIYRIFYSSTIIVSDDCHPYRRTIANETDCPKTNWEGGQCIYMAIPKENKSCSANNNMCREYKSAEGYNYQKIIESSFGTKDTEGWSGGTISNESVRRNDYSLKIAGSATHDLAAGDLESGKIYVVEFLAKGSGSVNVKFTDGTTEVSSQSAAITNDWFFYTLKIPNDNNGLILDQTDNKKIVITINGYLDNIVLKKIQNLYLIKNSWTTPKECETADDLTDGTASESMIGCESYKDSDNKTVNLRKFNSLCFEDVVGCEAVAKTKIIFNSAGNSIETSLDFMVLNNKFMCTAKDNGCTRLGLITSGRDDGSQYTFTDQYKLVDPDDAGEQCSLNEVFCDSYNDGENKNYYFKDPLYMTCEFRNGAWLKSGNNDPCTLTNNNEYSFENHCLGGVALDGSNSCHTNADCTNLAYPGSPGVCSNWVGLCNESSSGCREYQDPQNPTNCNKSYVNYLQYYNSQVNEKQICNYYYYKDVEPCKSGVAPSQGCVGFKDSLNQNLNIRSFKVCDNDNAITCETDNDCAGNGRCRYVNTQ